MGTKLTIEKARLASNPVYTPANGTNSANCRLTLMDNGRSYIDKTTGQRVEGKTQVIYVTGWNSKSLQPGKRGLADLLTSFACGSEISCECRIRGYESRVMDPVTKQFIMASNGQELKVRRTEYLVIPGTIIWGKEAQKVVDQEVISGARPEAWDGKFYPKTPEEQAMAQAHMAQWKQIRQERNSALYQGGPSYNHAEVKQPAANAYATGVVAPAGQVQAAPIIPAVNAGAVPGGVPAVETPFVAAGAAGAGAPTIMPAG